MFWTGSYRRYNFRSRGRSSFHSNTWQTQKNLHFAEGNLLISRRIVAHPYINLLRTLNPKAKFARNVVDITNPPLISGVGNGFIADKVMSPLQAKGRAYRRSDNVIKRHVVSRLTYSLIGLAAIVTRAADGVIALVATPLSFITLGKIESINNLAFRSLQFPAIIQDEWFCFIKILNPQAGVFFS